MNVSECFEIETIEELISQKASERIALGISVVPGAETPESIIAGYAGDSKEAVKK